MADESSTKPQPELLLDPSERALRIILRAIIRAHPDEQHRTEAKRVAQAAAVLLGRKPQRGAPGVWRDDMLEMMAFMYSVATYSKRSVSIEHLAKAVIDMPGGVGKDPEGAIVKDLVRKFTRFKEELLARHSYDGREDFFEFYGPIGDALSALQQAGVAVDRDLLPPSAAQQGR